MYRNAELSNVQRDKVNSCNNTTIKMIQHQPLVMAEEKAVNSFFAILRQTVT